MLNEFFRLVAFCVLLLSSFKICSQNESETPKDTIPDYQKLYTKACKLTDSLKYKEALPLLKKAIKLKADYWQAYNKRAFIEIQQKEYKDAEKDLIKSELILPQNYETLKLKGINFYLNNKFKECKGAIDTAVAIAVEDKIDDAEIYYYQALLMFKGKSYKTALNSCESATEINKNYIDAIVLKGEIRFTMRDYNYAIKELNEAIKLMKPEKPDYKAYKLRAKSKFEIKDFKGAVTDWSVYIDGNPNEEEALISRGAAKINANDNTGAIADLDEAIKLNPKNPISYCYRGVAKGGNKNNTEALKDLDYAIKIKFDYAEAYVQRAYIKMASKDKYGACDDLKKADGLGDEKALNLSQQFCK